MLATLLPLNPSNTTAGAPEAARQLLRSGPFSALRDNIRALGEYAAASSSSSSQSGAVAANTGQLVTNFFRALEGLDLIFYQAFRDKKDVDKEAAAAKLQATTSALDELLATVPADVMTTAKKVLERVNAKSPKPSGAGAADDVPSSSAEDLKGLI
jgi:hypothetical protein